MVRFSRLAEEDKENAEHWKEKMESCMTRGARLPALGVALEKLPALEVRRGVAPSAWC